MNVSSEFQNQGTISTFRSNIGRPTKYSLLSWHLIHLEVHGTVSLPPCSSFRSTVTVALPDSGVLSTAYSLCCSQEWLLSFPLKYKGIESAGKEQGVEFSSQPVTTHHGWVVLVF